MAINFDKITDQICSVLDQHDIPYKWDIVRNNIVDEWYARKSGLIDLLSQHPNWDDECLAIVWEQDYQRKLDEDAFCTAYSYIYNQIIDNLFCGKEMKVVRLHIRAAEENKKLTCCRGLTLRVLRKIYCQAIPLLILIPAKLKNYLSPGIGLTGVLLSLLLSMQNSSRCLPSRELRRKLARK